MLALAGSVLLTSLIGSPHCAGMCGGFVVFYAGHETRRRWLAHIAYNGGRLVSYATLGALAGVLGAGIERLGLVVGVGRAAAWLAGIAMIVWGGVALLRAAGVGGPVRGGTGAHGVIARALRAVHAQPAPVRGATMGLLSTLLPCGWLYTYVAIAAGTGSPAAGALVMAVFWVGTVPVLAGLALLAQSALGGLRRRLPLAAAVLMIVLGLLTLNGRLQPHMHGMHDMHAPVEDEATHTGHGMQTPGADDGTAADTPASPDAPPAGSDDGR